MAGRRAQNQRLLPQSRCGRWQKTRRVVGNSSYGPYGRIYFEYGVSLFMFVQIRYIHVRFCELGECGTPY